MLKYYFSTIYKSFSEESLCIDKRLYYYLLLYIIDRQKVFKNDYQKSEKSIRMQIKKGEKQ